MLVTSHCVTHDLYLPSPSTHFASSVWVNVSGLSDFRQTVLPSSRLGKQAVSSYSLLETILPANIPASVVGSGLGSEIRPLVRFSFMQIQEAESR